jgi:hypothetical protein
VDEEEAGVSHMAAEGRHGHSPGLQHFCAANGDIQSLEAAVQEKVFGLFFASF